MKKAIGIIVFGFALFWITGTLNSKTKYPAGDRTNWHQGKYLVGSFQQLHKIFFSREVKNGDKVVNLPYERIPKKIHFTWHGKRTPVQNYLKTQNISGLLIIKDGKIAKEIYRNGADEKTKFTSWSISKSIVSSLIGVALDEGKIESIEDPIEKYIPELEQSDYKGTKIVDLLQMSSGISFKEVFSPDPKQSDLGPWWEMTMARNQASVNEWVKQFKRIHPAGEKFSYSSADAQILGWLVTKVTGKSLSDYASEKIWQKIGAEQSAYWLIDNKADKGMEAAFCCFNASLRDYGRFGLLMLNQGKFGDTKVVEGNWVTKATRISERKELKPGQIKPTNPLGYQYQWWTMAGQDKAYLAKGLFGQYLYINPAKNLIIVQTGAWKRGSSVEMNLQALAFFKTIANSY